MNGLVRRCFAPALGAVVALTVAAGGLEAQGAAFGVHGSVGTDTDLGIGGRVAINIPDVNLEGQGTVDVFFPDGFDYFEFNGNLFYHFHLEDTSSVLPYAGGGLNVGIISPEGPAADDRTEVGINLGGGVRFRAENNIAPFVEARVVAGGVEQFVVSGGLLFGNVGGI